MPRFGALTLAVLMLALAGCGGDDNDNNNGGGGGGGGPRPADQADTAAEESDATTSETDVQDSTPDRGDGHSAANSAEDSEPKPPSHAEYVRAADRICRTAQAAIARRSAEYRDLLNALARGKIKPREYFRRGGALNERSGAIAQRAVADLKELPTPTSGREPIEAYLQGAAAQAAILTQQGRALRAGRTKEVGKLNRRIAPVGEKTRTAARRVGFHACGGGGR